MTYKELIKSLKAVELDTEGVETYAEAYFKKNSGLGLLVGEYFTRDDLLVAGAELYLGEKTNEGV
jgi:hypothetical protein